VLRHDTLETALAALGQQARAIVKCLRMQETGDPGALDKMTEAALTIFQLYRAEIVAVQGHEVGAPKQEIIIKPLVDGMMERLETVHVHWLGVDHG